MKRNQDIISGWFWRSFPTAGEEADDKVMNSSPTVRLTCKELVTVRSSLGLVWPEKIMRRAQVGR